MRDEAYYRAVERELGTRDLSEANRRTRMVWEWERNRVSQTEGMES